MKSLLDALKTGRLVELPADCDKEAALELLANLIEAVPDIGTRADLVKGIMEREAEANTGIGHGVACPHCRVAIEGELLCAVGWSPRGIAYGSSDGKSVHLVVMYYVPDQRRNTYLKEISGLAKALSIGDSIETISALSDIHTVRDKLLDWVTFAISEALPEAKARMIKLEARQAKAAAIPAKGIAGLRILPFRLVAWPGSALVLCADPTLADSLDKIEGLSERLSAGGEIDTPGWRIVVMAETPFARDRKEFEAVALRVEEATPAEQ
jgi:mannitol/fructose-specific phosphotransferase system IIA component (Ntr-type)